MKKQKPWWIVGVLAFVVLLFFGAVFARPRDPLEREVADIAAEFGLEQASIRNAPKLDPKMGGDVVTYYSFDGFDFERTVELYNRLWSLPGANNKTMIVSNNEERFVNQSRAWGSVQVSIVLSHKESGSYPTYEGIVVRRKAEGLWNIVRSKLGY